MTFYEQETGEPFSSTAVYPNRVADKQALESVCDLVEHGSNGFEFRTKSGSLIARGYLRIVYGDHGPYIELAQDQIEWANFECERKGVGFYNKWYSKVDRVLVYEQLRSVKELSNPPPGRFSFNGNRPEGYADYRIGRCYVDPYAIMVVGSENESAR